MKYKITDIRQRSNEVKGVRVLFLRISYETETEYKGSVDVLKKTFSEKAVREAIEYEIKEMVKLEKEKEVEI